MSRLEQRRFTISEVAADWHELMIPWRIMRPSVARYGENWTRGAAHRHRRPNHRTMPSPLNAELSQTSSKDPLYFQSAYPAPHFCLDSGATAQCELC